MVYIEIENEKIKSIVSSSKLPSDGCDWRQVPAFFPGVVGQRVAEFTDMWELRPLVDRLRDRLIPEADRYKAAGEELVPKSLEELVRDGLEPAPAGLKLDPAAPAATPQLIPMTRAELVTAGQLSPDEAHELDLRDEEQQQLAYLASTDWYAVRQAETSVLIPNEIATRRQTARDRISEIRAELGD